MSPSSDSKLDVPTSPYLTDRTKEKTQFSVHSTEVEVKQGSVFDIEGQKSGIVRGLKSRHIQPIALGSAIGTGLFIGSRGCTERLRSCTTADSLRDHLFLCVVDYEPADRDGGTDTIAR